MGGKEKPITGNDKQTGSRRRKGGTGPMPQGEIKKNKDEGKEVWIGQ